MDLFLSHFVNRFDAKGRISVPASFRAILTKDGFDGLFVQPALDAPALDCGGKALLKEIDALLESRPPYSREREDLATALLGASEILRLDSEGRIILGERCEPRWRSPTKQPLSAMATSFRSGSRHASSRISRRPRIVCGGCGRNSTSRRRRREHESGRGEDKIAAGEPPAISVLLAETLGALALRPGEVFVDGTFGAGGYSRALLEKRRARRRDRPRSRGGRGRRGAGRRIFGPADAGRRPLRANSTRSPADAASTVNGVALDVGVSSMQLDEAGRGFSLRRDAPLDMRMESQGPQRRRHPRRGRRSEIADIIFRFGEERAARRIARAIVADRKTLALRLDAAACAMVARVAPARPGEAPIQRRAPSRRCASRSTTNLVNCSAASQRPSGFCAGRAGWRSSASIRSRIAS